MKRKHLCVLVAVAFFVALPLLATNENINYEDINKIKAEGMSATNSKVMELNSWLDDVYAPRLTGSPMAEKAAQWAMSQMKEWGLVNVKMEPWPNRRDFVRGWTNDKFYMASVSPEQFPIPGTPTAWTPGTNGLVSGEVVLVTAATQEELDQFKGKLKGKWVITQTAPDVAAYWDAPAKRYTNDDLARMELQPPAQATEFGITPPGAARQGAPAQNPPARQGGPGVPAAPTQQAAQQAAQQGQRAGAPAAPQQAAPAGGRGGGPNFSQIRTAFMKAEGALGTLSTAPRGHGIYTIGGADRTADPATLLPAIAIAAEQYGRIARALAKGVPVTIEADIKNTFYDNPPVFNIVGDIPGTDKADEIVLIGGHFDCWHAGTGAADNGVGSAAMMEAMRILKATGVKLRRTVRIGLWEGEEQGLLGSAQYVELHLASRPPTPEGAGAGAGAAAGGGGGGRGGAAQGPLQYKPEYAKFAGYFNIDNGTGALRGVYLQGNDAVGPIFREWMEPFRSLGMTTLTIRNTGGTDHQSFDGVGLPGFQFIQDPVEYDTITHHTNMDTYERLQPRDCMQMATIVAGFAYLAANRDQILPRKPAAAQAQGRRGGPGQP